MGWLIFLGIILFIILLLCLPVHAVAEWNGELKLKIRYLFLSFTLLPEQDRKKKEKKQADEKKEEAEKEEKKPKKKRSAEEIIDGLVDGTERYSKGAKMILRNIRVHYLEGFWKISADDAAECAIRYGRICALLNSFFAAFRNILRIEKTKLRIFPDFVAEEDEIRVLADFEANPIVVIFGALKIAIQYIKSISSKKNRNSKALRTKRSAKKECA